MSNEHHIKVNRTARYFTVGEKSPDVTDVWFACHGYGQLASDFAKEFEIIAAPERLIVVPEALSKFYIPEGPGFHGPDAKIGATWMTREDRENEIIDYVDYLDSLAVETLTGLDRTRLRVTVLGFSQGGATASRWLERGKMQPDRLILWGSAFATDMNLERAASIFQTVQLEVVYGKRDQFAGDKLIADYEALMKDNNIPYEVLTFEGGHRMDRDTLKRLAELRN